MNSASFDEVRVPWWCKQGGWTRGASVLLLSQLLFWSLLYLIERNTQPENFDLPVSLPLYLSDATGQFDLAAEPIMVPFNNEPAYVYRDKSGAPKGLFRIGFDRSAGGGDLSFYIGWDGQFIDLILNGEALPISGKGEQQ